MSNLWLALEGGWHVLLAGLILGAGLPAIFALGIRALSYGAVGEADTDHQPHVLGKAVAYLCFTIVALAIFAGIGTVVASGMGFRLVFDHVVPTFVAK